MRWRVEWRLEVHNNRRKTEQRIYEIRSYEQPPFSVEKIFHDRRLGTIRQHGQDVEHSRECRVKFLGSGCHSIAQYGETAGQHGLSQYKIDSRGALESNTQAQHTEMRLGSSHTDTSPLRSDGRT